MHIIVSKALKFTEKYEKKIISQKGMFPYFRRKKNSIIIYNSRKIQIQIMEMYIVFCTYSNNLS